MMGQFKDFLIKNKIMRTDAEIAEYDTTCQGCKKKFPKEQLRGAIPIGRGWGQPLCQICWKHDLRAKIGILAFTVIIIALLWIYYTK